MTSLYVQSLFTNILTEETINICSDSIFGNEAKINNFSRNDFEKLLRMALQNNFSNFDGKIYKQTDGVAMGSLFGPSLLMHFYVLINKHGSMIALKVLNLHITEDM